MTRLPGRPRASRLASSAGVEKPWPPCGRPSPRSPIRESALAGVAHLAASGGRVEDAIGYWRRAIKISPWRADYQAELGPLYFKIRDWHSAAEACREALRLDPTNLAVRHFLVRCELHLGNVEAARRELQILLGFDPPDRDDLQNWLTQLSRPR